MAASDAAAERTPLRRMMGARMLVVFIIGDILGAGIYALIGEVVGEVGGALWMPLAIAFVIAALTAWSYAELVGKYPRAAGAALYTHRAFGRPFVTFMVAFAVHVGRHVGEHGCPCVRRQLPGGARRPCRGWLVAIGFLTVVPRSTSSGWASR